MALKIGPVVTRMITSKTLQRVRRGVAEMRRRLKGAPHEVIFFHQMDDPYSHLLAQWLPDFQSRYNVNVRFFMVQPPSDDIAPERTALENYSRRDAAKLAPFHALEFHDIGRQPWETSLELAERALAASSDPINIAAKIGAAYWADDTNALERMALVSPQKVKETITQGTQMRHSLGHYLGGMVYYGGEWYWGVDRLPYLEIRLAQSRLLNSGCRPIARFQDRPTFMLKPAKRRLTVEFYPSARSPYSYVSMPETLDLPNHYPIDLVVRPVLPMVMRGLPVPRRKGFYIMRDTKREANRIGVPFGWVADPVGEPVRRCYSLFPWADSVGKGGDFLHAFCRLVWSQGVDMGSDAGLRKAVEEVGLDWNEAKKLLGNTDWEAPIEENRQQMMESGLWGVPSYRLLDSSGKELYSCWGRDRLWLLMHEIQTALM